MAASGTTIILNGRVCQHRNDGSQELHFADCLVVKNGIIEFVGSRDDPAVKAAQDGDATVKDAEGKVILPGFIDGHIHLLILGQSLTKAGLEGCKTLEDIRAEVKRYAQANPDVKRIFCKGWMHSMTPDGVDASLLDDLDPRPIFIDSKDLHSTWCNSAGLAEVCAEFGFTKDTPNPAGGAFQRDSNGELNGLFSESAVFETIWPFVARVASMEERKEAIKAAIKAFNAVGYTGMIDMAMDETIWEPLLELRRETGGLMGMRLAAYWLLKPAGSLDEVLAQVDHAAELAKQYNAETSRDCRIVGIKVICDGIIDACTASLKEPYSTGESTDPIWKEEVLDAAVARAHALGLQTALHAIGDKTVKMVIDVLERNTDKSRRPRVEHIELASAEDARRLGQLGITASIQPVHSDPAILRAWPRLLGEERCKRAFPYREFADGGAPLALGSDAPTAPHHPLPNMYVATTRRSAREPELQTIVNPEFALSVYQAVVGATEGSAYSCFADAWTGKLEVGKSADFVVCDMEMEATDLIKGVVTETWFEGNVVYQR
ncbi:amidohydrolase family protein [Sarocladium implicatum]|nr:amidohydrolase family protein [Sarocladium implicatum]